MSMTQTSDARNAVERDPRWRQIRERDASADGAFVYAVKTTGIYCRPSCPSGPAKPENISFHRNAEIAEKAGYRACRRCKPDEAQNVAVRVDRYDWVEIPAELGASGFAVLKNLLAPSECRMLAELYTREDMFRSTVHMARHGFGKGEYRYFCYPLPGLVAGLRDAFYPRLVPVANAWNAAMKMETRYPETHGEFLVRCHEGGQTRPTPLLLQYGPGDYNCLHQDLYGDLAFPLQIAILLSAPGDDFTGGEFVLTEQRPRMQSRAEVVPLCQGDAVIFAVHQRPVNGAHGIYRVNMRHGVSRLRSGKRHTLGIIFHDAT